MVWNINLNTPARRLKGILLLFEDPAAGAMGPAFGSNSEFYYNPLITRVQIAEAGVPCQLYAQRMLRYQHWEEIVKKFVHENLIGTGLPSTNFTTYIQSRYALWLDFRNTDDRRLHGSGRRVGDGGGLPSSSIR